MREDLKKEQDLHRTYGSQSALIECDEPIRLQFIP